MRPAVTYTPYATSSKEQSGDIITFAHFEEGNLLCETRNNTDSDDASDSESIMMSERDMENLDEWQQVRNLQCHIYVFYFVRVLYGKLRRMLRQRR